MEKSYQMVLLLFLLMDFFPLYIGKVTSLSSLLLLIVPFLPSGTTILFVCSGGGGFRDYFDTI